MTNIKDYENTVTEWLYDLMANINPCVGCKSRSRTTDKCGNCCWNYPSEFVMGDESEAEKPTEADTIKTGERRMAVEQIEKMKERLREAKHRYDRAADKTPIRACGAEYRLLCDIERMLEDWEAEQ